MAKKMTKTNFRKNIAGLTEKELVDLLWPIYQKDPFFQNATDLAFADEASATELVATYKKRLDKIFFPTNLNRGFSLKQANDTLKEFAKLTKDPALLGDLQLYFAELGTEFTAMYGDMEERFYTAVGRAYEGAVDFAAEDEALYAAWSQRLEKVYHEAQNIGWGFADHISKVYVRLPWQERE